MSVDEEPPRFVINDEDGMDETDVNLRGYLSGLSPDKLATYNPDFTDEELMAWEENFRDDGHLLLVCCTRDVDLDEYREAMQEILASKA